jgi:hypothetical protein
MTELVEHGAILKFCDIHMWEYGYIIYKTADTGLDLAIAHGCLVPLPTKPPN